MGGQVFRISNLNKYNLINVRKSNLISGNEVQQDFSDKFFELLKLQKLETYAYFGAWNDKLYKGC